MPKADSKQALRSIHNIRLTPIGKRALELYEEGKSAKEVREQLVKEGLVESSGVRADAADRDA